MIMFAKPVALNKNSLKLKFANHAHNSVQNVVILQLVPHVYQYSNFKE